RIAREAFKGISAYRLRPFFKAVHDAQLGRLFEMLSLHQEVGKMLPEVGAAFLDWCDENDIYFEGSERKPPGEEIAEGIAEVVAEEPQPEPAEEVVIETAPVDEAPTIEEAPAAAPIIEEAPAEDIETPSPDLSAQQDILPNLIPDTTSEMPGLNI